MIDTLASIAVIVGALLFALNIKRVSFCGALIMVAGNALWMQYAVRTDQDPLWWVNLAFLGINVVGAIRRVDDWEPEPVYTRPKL